MVVQGGQLKNPPPGFEHMRKAPKKKSTMDEKFRNLKMFFKKEKTMAATVAAAVVPNLQPKPKNQWNGTRDMEDSTETDGHGVTIDFVKNQYAACNNFTALQKLQAKLNDAYHQETIHIAKLESDIDEVEQTLKFDKVSFSRDVKGTGFCGTGHVPSRPARDGRDRDSKIIFLAGRDGTGLRFSGQRDRQKTGQDGTKWDPAIFFILLKIICDKGIIKQTDEIVGY